MSTQPTPQPDVSKWKVRNGPAGCFIMDGDVIVAEFYESNAEFVMRCVRSHETLVAVLKEIEKGEGAFNRDPLKHATNVIEQSILIARAALADATGEKP